MALGPLVTFGLGRGRSPIESLAVWPVVNSMLFLFRSGGVAFQEVGIALSGSDSANAAAVRRTARILGLTASATLAVVAFSPLQEIWFVSVSGLTPYLASFAVWPLRWLVLLPGLEYLLSVQRVPWILAHRTHVITVATALEAVVLALALVATVGALNVVAVIGGAIAMLAGRVAANAFLLVRSRSACVLG
jgi:progressive ankylosis protein